MAIAAHDPMLPTAQRDHHETIFLVRCRKQPIGRRVEVVIRAALEVLERLGLEGVSLRAVAEHLDVRMNTMVWHVKTRERMRDLMADAILSEMSLSRLPTNGDKRAREIARRYRNVLLRHRDGAKLVTGTLVAGPGTLSAAEALVGALAATRSDRDAAWTAWNIVYLVLGLVAEEQASSSFARAPLEEALATGAYPCLQRTVEHLSSPFVERFEHGLDLLVRQHSARHGPR